ncbi:MAG TPA: GNAT family N-acetyltransferase [Deltaproteobacteria bacterium]|nr:GNAT family N-acetyltransferase [Deltaproteobacteria bacterium]
MTYIIRDASPSDTGLLAGLIRGSFQDVAMRFELTVENSPRHPSNCTDEWIVSEMEKGVHYYVLQAADGLPCGCAALEHASRKKCYLERLGVLPAYRGRGYGTALVEHVLRACMQTGADLLQIGIISADTTLRSWYESLGFNETHTATFAHLPFEVSFMVKVVKGKRTAQRG